LVVAGEPAAWDAPDWPIDSLHAVVRRALERVQAGGYYRARVDSVVTRSKHASPRVSIFVTKGPKIPIGSIRLRGASAIPESTLRRVMMTTVGSPLDPLQLEADIEALLDRYEAEGYPLARIEVAETVIQPGHPPTLRLALRVDEGPALWLKGVDVPSGARTNPSFAAHAARLPIGAPLVNYDAEVIRQRLEDTGLFESVGRPTLRVEEDGGAVVDIPLKEEPPGTFDLVLGYLPPAGQRTAGQVVGNGYLQLENLFGGGRAAGLAIDRRPGRVSTADVHVADPYLFGAPVRVAGRFTGEQRDSTFSKQVLHATVGYLLDAGAEVFGSVTREATQPGQAGGELQGEMQLIPRSVGWFTGLGIRIRRVDRAVNPRRGLVVETTLERGQKRRRFDRRMADGDTVRVQDRLRQERLRLTSRVYVPTWANQLVAGGLEAAVLRSDTYDRSDLFRIGGATSLRGYDEDRFIGHAVGRLLLEYRYQIDRASYAYVFGDLGVVDRPELDTVRAVRDWHPGYGVGIQVRTALGLIRATYALNPDDTSPTDGRVHLGLSVGL
jgi:outer membrane protein assembly factor BamA